MSVFSGTLVSLDVLTRVTGRRDAHASHLCRLLREALGHLGPASGARGVFDLLGHPLFTALGFEIRLTRDAQSEMIATLMADRHEAAILAVTGWGGDLTRVRAATAALTPFSRLRWWIGLNGPVLRIVDLTRVYARRLVDIDVERLAIDEASVATLAGLLAARRSGGLPGLEDAVDASDRHRGIVGRSLQVGVEHALERLVSGFVTGRRRRPAALDAAFSDALTVVYRILFLLFAEARGLVPRWHPLYRDGYTIEALRPRIEREPRPPGLWASLQAISRYFGVSTPQTSAACCCPPPPRRPTCSPLPTPIVLDSATPDDSWHMLEQSGRLLVPKRRASSW